MGLQILTKKSDVKMLVLVACGITMYYFKGLSVLKTTKTAIKWVGGGLSEKVGIP